MNNELENKIQQVADQLEIDSLLSRYAEAIDRRDYQLLDTCFTPDALVDYSDADGVAGPYPEARAWLEEVLAPIDEMQHFISNKQIKLDGDSATGECYTLNINGFKLADSSSNHLVVGAKYIDEFTRTPKGWRISRRKETRMTMMGDLPEFIELPDVDSPQ